MKKRSIRISEVILVLLVFGILINKEAHADIICVDPFNFGCFATIQEGINAALGGDTVEVASGTYVEQVTLKSGITLKGENINTTFIWYNNDAVLASNTSNTVIQGFTITSANGSGIYASASGSGTRDLSIIGNKIINSNIGIRFRAIPSNPHTSQIYGTIWNNLIFNNTTAGISLETGASYSGPCAPKIVNNVIFGNLDNGIMTYDGQAGKNSAPFISNNIIMSNGNYGITNIEMTPTITFNDVYANTTGDYDNVTVGPGNISVDPEFVDEFNGDFHLLPTSPAIDAGNPSYAPPYDIDGYARPYGGGYDIGAYEYWPGEPPPEPCEGDFDGDGVVDGSDLAVFAANFGRTDCP